MNSDGRCGVWRLREPLIARGAVAAIQLRPVFSRLSRSTRGASGNLSIVEKLPRSPWTRPDAHIRRLG
jgi:hypothetical protein